MKKIILYIILISVALIMVGCKNETDLVDMEDLLEQQKAQEIRGYEYKARELAYASEGIADSDVEYYNNKELITEWVLSDEYSFVINGKRIGLGIPGTDTCPFSKAISREKTNEDMHGDSYRIKEVFDGVIVIHYVIFRPDENIIINPIFYIETTREDMYTHRGIKVSDDVDKLLQAYPEVYEDNGIYYFPAGAEPAGDHIVFYTKDEVITKIIMDRVLP